MSKNVPSVLDQFDPQALPAHLQDMAAEGNITERATVPTLSYEGKTWTIIKDGEKKKLTRKNEDGDVEPITTMRVIILGYNDRRGRAYYEGAYDPSKVAAPTCWSEDGLTASARVSDEACPSLDRTCQNCPMAAKGSKVTEQGKQITACSQHRMLAVVPAARPDFQPLRLKLAMTSDWDKDGTDLQSQGWYAFQQFLDQFRAKKVPHTALVVTKMRFDPNVAFPKVVFSPDRWLTAEELAIVKPVAKSDEVKQLLNGTWSPNGGDGTKAEDDAPAAPAPAKKAPAKLAAKPAPEPDDEEEEQEETPPPKPAKKAPAKKAAPPPEPEDDEAEDDGLEGLEDEAEEEAPPPRKAAPKPAAKAPAKKAAPPPEEDEDDGMGDLEGEIETPAPKPAKKAAKPSREAEDADEMPEFLDRRSPAVKAAAKGQNAAPAKGKAQPAATPADGLDDLLGEWGDD